MRTTTPFDVRQHHIHLKVVINIGHGLPWRVAGVLDTGAPWTEVSDKFLHHAGLISELPDDGPMPRGRQTQRYGKIVLPEMEICGQRLANMEVRVARFEEIWNVGILVGLDFFRHFPVTIDYQRAVLEVG